MAYIYLCSICGKQMHQGAHLIKEERESCQKMINAKIEDFVSRLKKPTDKPEPEAARCYICKDEPEKKLLCSRCGPKQKSAPRDQNELALEFTDMKLGQSNDWKASARENHAKFCEERLRADTLTAKLAATEAELAEVKAGNKQLHMKMLAYIDVKKELTAERDRLKEALEFYADGNSWTGDNINASSRYVIERSDREAGLTQFGNDPRWVGLETGGKRARAALKGEK